MSLTKAQVQRMLTVRPGDTFEAKNGLTYMPTHEVKAELSRIFGPGNWDHTIHDVRLLWESSEDVSRSGSTQTMWRACYLVACTLRVRDYEGNPIFETTEYHAEANSNLPDRGEAHAMAVTSAESYALRRAALDLGDAFGLHLYDKGSKAPLVKGTLLTFGDSDSPMYDAEAEAARKEAFEQAKADASARMQGAMKQGPREDPIEAAIASAEVDARSVGEGRA